MVSLPVHACCWQPRSLLWLLGRRSVRNSTATCLLPPRLQELATNIDPAVKFELVGGGNLSMLITWEGSDPSLRPVIINCHYDVRGGGGGWAAHSRAERECEQLLV